jgi:hypothetical protein
MEATQPIRPDYHRATRWTLAEAAREAGVQINTVSSWLSRKKFKRGYRHGPYRVDASTFLRFLETGKAQA